MTTLVKPADLSIYEIHSPEAIAAHRNAVLAYYDGKRAEEQRIADAARTAQAEAKRPPTAEEQYATALKRQTEQRAKEEARRLERVEAEMADAAYMASFPDVAEISAANEFSLLTKLQCWFSKGYLLNEGSIVYWRVGCYSICLNKPAKSRK